MPPISTAIDAAAVARTVGIKTEYKNLRAGRVFYLPQRVVVVAQGSSSAVYSTDKRQVTSSFEAGSLYGFGSPIHLIVRQLLPINGDGVGTIPVTVYPLEDAGGAQPSDGNIEPTGTQSGTASYTILVNEIRSQAFTISNGDGPGDILQAAVDAINAVVEMPVTATVDTGNGQIDVTSKWAGASANNITLSVEGPDNGITFTVTQPTNGATNPTVDSALTQVGNVWETLFINALEIEDTTALDAYDTFVSGRWGALQHKPALVFTGVTAATVSAATTVSDARPADYSNVQIPAPGSDELPFIVAARAVARIAVRAQNNPAFDYGSLSLDGLVPGTDGEQWDYVQRDAAVKAGSSTTEVRDGIIHMSDTVTFYHPSGDPLPAYRYVVDIVKLMNIIYNVALIFNTDEWDGAPLVADSEPTNNPDAKKPKSARAALTVLADSLGDEALIGDRDAVKDSIDAGINGQNPKRLDAQMTAVLSGNTNQRAIDLNFGFLFGGS